MRWNRAAWEKRFDADMLIHRDSTINRYDVVRYVESVSTEDDAVRAFIASMIWGYGPIGYGAYRTERILHANPRHGERLLQVARLAREGDRASAFAAARDPRLKHLGIAFGSKYLYFCSMAAGGDKAIMPVLDSVVARWLSVHTTFSPKLGWDRPEYERYVELMHCWADELTGTEDEGRVRADHVEQLIFDSEWNPPEAPQTPRAEIVSLLARLRVVVGELDPGVVGRWQRRIDDLGELLEEEKPDDGID